MIWFDKCLSCLHSAAETLVLTALIV